jgi:proteasome lid subunit RPN8/RPN11
VSDGLSLPAAVVDAILAHAGEALPLEACGLLAGHPGSGEVTRYHPARNAIGSRSAYEVDPEDLVRIMFAIEAHGEELAAVFHSHPATPAVPSASDIRDAAYPVVQVIASLNDPTRPALRGWRLRPGAAPREVPLRIGAAQQSPTGRWSTIAPASASRTTSRPHEPSSPPDR